MSLAVVRNVGRADREYKDLLPASLSTTSPSFKESAGKASKSLALIRLPYKGISSLFAWGEVLPLRKGLSDWILTQRVEVKLFSSMFNLPKFFFKQIRLIHSLINLKTQYAKGEDLPELVHGIKKVFLRSMSSLIVSLKIPLLFNKLQLIDLSQLSRSLVGKLDKSETLLTLCFTGMKLVNSAWSLEKKLKMDRMRPSLSPKTKEQILKVGSYALHFFATALVSAALFLGLPASPIVTVVLSNLSFTLALVRTSFWDKNPVQWSEPRYTDRLSFSHLPA